MTDTSIAADGAQAGLTTEPPGKSAGVRLSIMMFLQYAVWGIWLPILATYLGAPVEKGGLGFSGGDIGWILGLAGALGAVGAPFIAGQVADRYLNAERALAILLLVGGVINFALAKATGFYPFLLLSIAYSVVYMPTLSLTNSIAFQNLDDPEKKFPPVRLWGTIGWVVASGVFAMLWLNSTDAIENTRRVGQSLTVSGVVSIAYAAYALVVLPKTPPKKDVRHPLAFAEAFGLLRNPVFLVATLVALPIAMIHQVYFFRAAPFFETTVGVSKQWLGWVMGIGQASEIFFLLILGLFIKRLGYKWVLIAGCLAYTLRFGLFSWGGPAMTYTVNPGGADEAVRTLLLVPIISQVLHGLCYGCFFAGSFLLVEKLATPDIRHSAQTVFGIIILGLGPILAGFYNQFVLGHFDHADKTTDYGPIWAIQAGIAFVSMVVLLIAFPNRPPEPTRD